MFSRTLGMRKGKRELAIGPSNASFKRKRPSVTLCGDGLDASLTGFQRVHTEETPCAGATPCNERTLPSVTLSLGEINSRQPRAHGDAEETPSGESVMKVPEVDRTKKVGKNAVPISTKTPPPGPHGDHGYENLAADTATLHKTALSPEDHVSHADSKEEAGLSCRTETGRVDRTRKIGKSDVSNWKGIKTLEELTAAPKIRVMPSRVTTARSNKSGPTCTVTGRELVRRVGPLEAAPNKVVRQMLGLGNSQEAKDALQCLVRLVRPDDATIQDPTAFSLLAEDDVERVGSSLEDIGLEELGINLQQKMGSLLPFTGSYLQVAFENTRAVLEAYRTLLKGEEGTSFNVRTHGGKHLMSAALEVILASIPQE